MSTTLGRTMTFHSLLSKELLLLLDNTKDININNTTITSNINYLIEVLYNRELIKKVNKYIKGKS